MIHLARPDGRAVDALRAELDAMLDVGTRGIAEIVALQAAALGGSTRC